MGLTRPIAVVAGMLVVAGCATAAGRKGAKEPTLAETIDAQVAREDAIVWTPRRLLTWADFKAQPPDDAGVVAARTNYTFIHGMQCAGKKFEYKVVAGFR